MAWEEWEQLKAAAADRHGAHMRLDQLPTGPGGGGGKAQGKLRSDKAAWSAAGEGVGSLRDGLGKALTKLQQGQTGLGDQSGCLTAAAQKGVYDSWDRRVTDISELCHGLADVLNKTGHDQLRTDQAVKEEIAGLKAGSEKGSDAGGPGKGR
ncbi:hypothetical protein JK359_00945 [Streptomyces actinomycinicus]|uniref:Uncharacterized protein n=1 Tax=Streptomyces actinomycinicus TaxID=1695166 RepID=A0A937EE88_9ACTN|nr:hypothetical protein [Streptomyces actinomycinicus]MBL1080554.1 hypothetical protein [Streptomyces actinomycinicus]